MFQYFLKNKKTLILYLILAPAMAVTSVLFASSLEPLVTASTKGNLTMFLKYVTIFVLAVMADTLVSYCHKISRENLRKEFLIGLKNDLFAGIMSKSFQEYRKEPPSYYISIMQRDVKKVSTDYFDSVCGIYRVSVSFMVTVAAMLRMNPIICLLNVAIALGSVLIPKIFERKLADNSEDASKSAAEFQNVISDAFIGFHTIKLYSVFSKIRKQIEDRNARCEEAECSLIKTNYSVSYISEVCTMIGFMLTMIISAYFAFLGKITVGAVMAISQLIGCILVPFEELPIFITNLKAVKVVIDKVQKYTNGTVQETNEWVQNITDFSLRAENVAVAFDDKKVVHGVNVFFEQGKKYVIMGESGCGKSTLVKLFVKMSACDGGNVMLGKRNIADISDNELYSVVNYMQQEVFLFDDTIKNNITLYKEYSPEAIQHAIECAGLKNYIGGLENGLETKINGNGYNLSGGEKQRIGIARALLAGAKVFILDEITSNLDVATERFIEELIMKLEGVTVIMITHRMNEVTLRSADEILVMKNGTVHEKGNFETLLDAKGLFYGYKMIAS
ncbi:ABC-type multidrug transport system, ATPase and permease component [Lachnospiraceae bacterium XBB1006]|nr:ABC-type multidrug transport system, ATPase and permease component [Lachnospiraceae bacterium XBB1006]